jgi:deoxyribodipyrimidine photolyase-related protein
MSTLRIVLGDQLSRGLSALSDLDRDTDAVLMMEVAEEGTYVRHHKQKIALILSAMRHFAEDLRERGVKVDYVRLDDADNTGTFTGELERAVARHRPERIILTEPGEWRVEQMIGDWRERFDAEIIVRPDQRFFASRDRFAQWTRGRRQWRMEHFYREMRREHDILMDGDQPEGGRWNFDAENRRKLPAGHALPHRRRFRPDETTAEVLALVGARFADHPGRLEPFGWPVTRTEALAALRHFIEEALPAFGDYQDAMKRGAPFVYHSLLSPALNIGLLEPREVCEAALKAWREGHAPLNAVEGFVRQILGWREYVRGVYWTLMPDYAQSNALEAERPLPDFYWTGETPMRCVAEAVGQTMDHAYSHHIQRLMVTGNFALLAGISPRQVERWYLAVYADAFEWVEMANTLGMATFADGGRMASKPYAASGAYIDRMSDFCGRCAYDVKQKSGPDACPFNRLYWAFLIRNEERLKDNSRLAMPYRTLKAWEAARRREIVADAEQFLSTLKGHEWNEAG